MTQIVINIEPDADGVYCGECKYTEGEVYYCPMSTGSERFGWWKRGPACLAASARHRRMVEALRDAEKQMVCSTYEYSKVMVRIRAILREEEGK